MGTRVYVFEAEGRERSQPHMARFFVPCESRGACELCTRWVARCIWSRPHAGSVVTQFFRHWDLASPKGELCVFSTTVNYEMYDGHPIISKSVTVNAPPKKVVAVAEEVAAPNNILLPLSQLGNLTGCHSRVPSNAR